MKKAAMKQNRKNFAAAKNGVFKIAVCAALFSFLLFLYPQKSFAGELLLQVTPPSPSPGQQFTVEAVSLDFDMLRANFRWFLNNKEVASGIGKTKNVFVAGEIGTRATIRATAVTLKNVVFEGTVSMGVGDIDLLIHPLTSVMPLYRGSSLPTPESFVEIYAIPHIFSGGAKIAPQNLVYEWTFDERTLVNESGGGKNKIIASLNMLRNKDYLVSVTVSTRKGDVRASKEIVISLAEPYVLFYRMNPLTGLRRIAQTNFAISKNSSFTIKAVPYFIDLESLKTALTQWRAGGNIISAQKPTNNYSLGLKAPAEGIAETKFSFSVRDANKIFQEAENEFMIKEME